MLYVGLDVHLRTTTCCILDAHGQVVKTFTRKGPWAAMVKTLRAMKDDFRGDLAVCFEASVGRVPHLTVLRDVCSSGVTAHIAEDGEVWHPAPAFFPLFFPEASDLAMQRRTAVEMRETNWPSSHETGKVGRAQSCFAFAQTADGTFVKLHFLQRDDMVKGGLGRVIRGTPPAWFQLFFRFRSACVQRLT